jgi:dTDP-glucose 4,6-dehydratase
MRILITGGAGFIGSHLSRLFLKKGHSVLVMDNLITGDQRNIEDLFGHKKFSFIKHNVTEFIHVPGPIDAVLHFASPASPRDYLEFPIPTLKVGALGTHKALGLAKEKKAVFLLASTSEVYGDPLISPQVESYWGNVNPVGPRGVYDEAKRFAEAMTMAYHRYHKMQVRIVRIFNTYGPRMRINDGRAIPNFISQALLGKPLTIYGKGDQTRSFCYVDDLVDGIYRLLLSKYNEPMNLGNPHEMTLHQLAQQILKLTKSRSKIAYHPLPQDDPKVRQPDIHLARSILKWEPRVSLTKGLQQTIKYIRKTL